MASLYFMSPCLLRMHNQGGSYGARLRWETRNFCEAGDSKDMGPKHRNFGQEEFVL